MPSIVKEKRVTRVLLSCLIQQLRIGSYGSPHTAITFSLNVTYKTARPLEKAIFIILKGLHTFDLLSKRCQVHPRASLQRMKLSIHTFPLHQPHHKDLFLSERSAIDNLHIRMTWNRWKRKWRQSKWSVITYFIHPAPTPLLKDLCSFTFSQPRPMG